MVEYSSPFAVPLIHDLPNSYELAEGEAPTVEEIVVVEFRPVTNYSIGPCWWQGVCGGQQVVGAPGGLFLRSRPTTSSSTRARPSSSPIAATEGRSSSCPPQAHSKTT